MLLSAKSRWSLENNKKELLEHLGIHAELDLADVAYTLHTAREEFNHRQMFVCKDRDDAITILNKQDNELSVAQYGANILPAEKKPSVVFLCSGVGEHYVNMGRGFV